MTAGVVNRAFVAIGIAAAASCGLRVPAGAQPQQGHTQQDKDQQEAQKRAQQDQVKAQKQHDQDRQQRQDLTRQYQEALMDRQAQRLDQYREHLDQQLRVAQQQSAQLQRQQMRIQSQVGYDYGRDLYLFHPPIYRYSRGGRYYETDQSGVDLLRRAVSAGYEQGRFAGLADQQDGWPFNYRNSFGYQDANYGYGGFYVDRLDYNTYLREGFLRGYEDGYHDRSQYGTYANGRPSILAAVLGAILVVEGTR